ncbi:uncharacterized protein J4E78_010114 [Alternaria triticimaculans]|uniref:uncharacterized protein n=1 Tax=Alternaria triticimaculans TaxID=297637 RepID=UPI0020C31565|nr:uncharacterized protein J4E78_010114 [Alternaria triticimaculans]KAI4642641.1 hypothetical protein J4E78_010114 [Alternaria triticimaculans]
MRLSLTLIAVMASIALTQDIASDEPTKVHVLWEPEKAADDAEWAAARQKGDDLICRLEATDEAAGRLNMDTRTPPSARNQWPDAALTSEISLWGWFTGEYDQKVHCQFADDNEDYHVNKVGTMFQDLGINSRPRTKGGDNVCYSIEHYNERAEDDDGDTLAAQNQYYDINGVWERCTGAHVRFGINQRGGLIIGLDFLNPRTAALANWDDSPAEASLPELKRASDIMMAYWLRGNIDPKSLKYYLVLTIENTMTLALINRVLKNHGLKEVPYWPGIIANMYDEEGPALLGE